MIFINFFHKICILLSKNLSNDKNFTQYFIISDKNQTALKHPPRVENPAKNPIKIKFNRIMTLLTDKYSATYSTYERHQQEEMHSNG